MTHVSQRGDDVLGGCLVPGQVGDHGVQLEVCGAAPDGVVDYAGPSQQADHLDQLE